MHRDVDSSKLMIFGASARAAAQSAVRAGLRPICADRFADEDLRETAELLPLAEYPQGLLSLAPLPRVSWMYTGALENHPRILSALADRRPLLGNPANVVRRVRDPDRLARVVDAAGLPALDVRTGRHPPPRDGTWLIKPLRGSAGRGICVWDADAPAVPRNERWYFQRRAPGTPMSGLFLATSVETFLVGVCRQLIGDRELGAPPFGYCGSTGPLALAGTTQRQLAQTGRAIASRFWLRGIFGIDFLLDGEVAWLTEVNPRYTASVEVHESALGLQLLGWHVRACRDFDSPLHSESITRQFDEALSAGQNAFDKHATTDRTSAKVVVYATFSFLVPDLVELARSARFAELGVEVADRPKAGSLIPVRAPVCALLTHRAGSIGLAGIRRAREVLAAAFARNQVPGLPAGTDSSSRD